MTVTDAARRLRIPKLRLYGILDGLGIRAKLEDAKKGRGRLGLLLTEAQIGKVRGVWARVQPRARHRTPVAVS